MTPLKDLSPGQCGIVRETIDGEVREILIERLSEDGALRVRHSEGRLFWETEGDIAYPNNVAMRRHWIRQGLPSESPRYVRHGSMDVPSECDGRIMVEPVDH